ncbi:MAG: anti-sigma factor antagonist [Planctomycetota bacterium]|nr:MAG: anti-sigma factor antagonist [Planctomycetota bacterium]
MAVLNFDIQDVDLSNGGVAKSVSLSGSIDASTNQLFESQLDDILSSGTNRVMLVLTKVKYINSTGLGTIVKCVDNFREQQGDIKLVGVPTKVIALFEMLGLLALFETYDTIDDAIASFAEGGDGDAAPVQPTAQFPIQFKHPKSGMALNVTQPGRFKDPRSGDYFSVDQEGKIEFYEMSKIKMVDIKVPCEEHYGESLLSLTEAVTVSCGLGSIAAEITAAVQLAWTGVATNAADPLETCNVIIVGDQNKIQVGFMSYGTALDMRKDDPILAGLGNKLDDLRHVDLPNNGHLLTLVKNAQH